MTKAEFEQYKIEQPLRLLELLRRVAQQANSALPSEARDYMKLPDPQPPEWFDPANPHLIIGELQRLFYHIPEHRPGWIELNEEQDAAIDMLIAIGVTVRSTQDIDHLLALRLIDTSLYLGHLLAVAHSMQWESAAEEGEMFFTRQKEKSKRKRPKRISHFKDKMQTAMYIAKCKGETFNTFHNAWATETKDGVRLTLVEPLKATKDQHYLLDDENQTAIQPKTYKYGTLEKWWYESKPS